MDLLNLLKLNGELIELSNNLIEYCDELIDKAYGEGDRLHVKEALRVVVKEMDHYGCISLNNIENIADIRKEEKGACDGK